MAYAVVTAATIAIRPSRDFRASNGSRKAVARRWNRSRIAVVTTVFGNLFRVQQFTQ